MASISKTVRPKRSNNATVSPVGYGLTVGRGTPSVSNGSGLLSYANKPGSYLTSSTLNFSQSVPTPNGGSAAIAGASGWNTTYDTDPGPGTNFTKINDATAPMSPSDVWELHWWPGTWGTSHGAGNIWRNVSGRTALYWSMTFKMDSGYDWHNISNKWLLLAGISVIVQIEESGRWFSVQNQGGSQNLHPGSENGATLNTWVNRTVTTGAWHQYEALVDITAGTWKQWLDGELILDASGVVFSQATFTEWNMTGHRGGGGETITTDMYWYLDDFHLAWP